MRSKLPYLFPVVLLVYSVYSFSQVDPNLVISNRPWFWQFQQTMWQLGYHNRPLSTVIFLGLVVALFFLYGVIIRVLQTKSLPVKEGMLIFLLSVLALLPSYPALSHDVFNYIFNAKMVVVYHANPHVTVALNFPEDPWIKFMNNVHTPAPYGYGWTGFSLLPYVFGNNYLQAELLVFRLTMIGFFLTTLWLITRYERVPLSKLALFAFNPLVLIEVIANIHNDIVMMAAAMGALVLFRKWRKEKNVWLILSAALLFIFSVSVKFATVALLGAAACYSLTKQVNRWRLPFPEWAVIWMWLPLLTNQSQRFLPWYLVWSLTFLPLVNNKIIRTALIAASAAGLLSYILILYFGDYIPGLLTSRSLILFGVPVTVTLATCLFSRSGKQLLTAAP